MRKLGSDILPPGVLISVLPLADFYHRLDLLELRTEQLRTAAQQLAHLQHEAAADAKLLQRLEPVADRVLNTLATLDFGRRQTLLRSVLDHVDITVEAVTLHFGITLPPKDPSDPDLDERGDPERPARTQSEKCGGKRALRTTADCQANCICDTPVSPRHYFFFGLVTEQMALTTECGHGPLLRALLNDCKP